MIWSVPVLKDTTIYESDPYRNTGLDPILELKKEGDVTSGDLTESRILIKFDLDNLETILTENSININNISANLRLYPVQEYDLPYTYNIEAKVLAVDWANGSGYIDYPQATVTSRTVTDGATWISTAGSGSATWSGSIVSGTEILYNTGSVIGGGLWVTSSIASQSFNFRQDSTVAMDVTSIVKNWYNEVQTNNGFILAFRHNDITASYYPEVKIQFYGAETTTVYEPQLYISWTGSVSYNTGSLLPISYEDNPIIYVRNFRGEFTKDKKVRVLLGARTKYPRSAFGQNSAFAAAKALPENSYYQIKDAHNDQIIIPFGNDTKISADSNGAYFDFYTTMLYSERFYKFEIKTEFSGLTEYFSSNDFIFKIVK